jgi:hypothetical protein
MCPVELAATTLVLNKGTPLMTVTYVITYPLVSPIGFVFQSPCHLCLFALNVPQLHIHNDKNPILLVIAIIFVQGRSSINNNVSVLHEVAILCNQHKLSIQEIEDEVIVFDGGNPKTPPILPPDGLTWWCKPISDLYVEDKTNPNLGLSCPWVNIPCHSFGWNVPIHYRLVWATKLSLAVIGLVFPALVLGYKSFNCSMHHVPFPTLFD